MNDTEPVVASQPQEDEAPEIPDIEVKKQIFDINFHPKRNIVACGLISGKIELYEYAVEGNKPIVQLAHHAESCRAVNFSPDGSSIYSASADCSLCLIDLEHQKLTLRMESKDSGHANPINCMQYYDENVLCTGDDNGMVKLWDIRQKDAMVSRMEFTENEDYISDMLGNPQKKHLLVTSGDGYFSCYDIRGKGKLEAMSDNLEDELLSVVLLKNGKKVVCGSQEGVLQIFTYGDFGDIDDRMPGHPDSIDTMVKIDEDTICTGSSDGLIRLVQIHPNKLLGVIGEHEDYPIEVIRKTQEGNLLASCSHDHRIKFWDIKYLYDPNERPARTCPMVAEGDEGSDDESDDSMDADSDDDGKTTMVPKGQQNFFADL